MKKIFIIVGGIVFIAALLLFTYKKFVLGYGIVCIVIIKREVMGDL